MDAIISACRKSCKAKAHACCSIFFTSVSGYKKRPIGMTNKKDAKVGEYSLASASGLTYVPAN
jgi:hypothetical protein